MLFVAFALLMAVSAPQARAALVVMEGGHAYERNYFYGGAEAWNTLVVCDTKPDGWWIRGEAKLAGGTIIADRDTNGAQEGCAETLWYHVEIVSIRVCRVDVPGASPSACTTWRDS